MFPGDVAFYERFTGSGTTLIAKAHDADQVAKIAASMAEFGWTVPVLVATEGELIAGHGRILAAAHLGLSEAPVIVLGHLTEAQPRAYRIADKKLTEMGGWDDTLLLQELQAILAEDFDLGLIGILEDELEALLHAGDYERTVIDDDAPGTIPDPRTEPITKPGDSWALGKHLFFAAMPPIRSPSPATLTKRQRALFRASYLSGIRRSRTNSGRRSSPSPFTKITRCRSLIAGCVANRPFTSNTRS